MFVNDFEAENEEDLRRKIASGQRGILPVRGKVPETISPETVESYFENEIRE